MPRARWRERALATPLLGCVTLVRIEFRLPRSMLDWEPPDIEEPSEHESGGVSAPDEPDELEVQVLDRERAAGAGLLKIERSRTAKSLL